MSGDRREGGTKVFGTGRLIFWRGGSVWIGHTEEKTGFHAHHLIQVTLALSDGAVHLQTPEQDWTAYKAALVASSQSHAFEARGQLVALLFVEPESREGRVLRERYRSGVSALATDGFAAEAAALVAAFRAHAPNEELEERARAVTLKLTSLQPPPARPLDPRVERAIEALRGRLGDAVMLAEIADTVHLSAERFRHLFLEETGMRFRPYVLWLRMEVAVSAIACGTSITEAAHAGGFADSAHFARTFKRMFGVPAISVQRLE